jgi:solute carrier family 25 oxoglutarate transporter 11
MRIVDGKPEFSGVLDVVRRVLANEVSSPYFHIGIFMHFVFLYILQGFFALWKGFFPYYMRLGPHTVRSTKEQTWEFT